ncbi:probable asparagine--tRNA ligase, mitochondrial [Malaya genurostris]|uniref:probable asparagine--tRNA ligase, mitochondrial n=1 Tax=Malaya genurostris TaxID=325434 RepID=UPI0026F3FEF5|nr:probable asparagine--tRNA ligase, mitochondrial [Malaya genurostris]
MLKRLSPKYFSSNVRCIYHLSRIKDISVGKHKDGDKIQLKGWVKTIRKMKDNVFLDLNDGSCATNFQLALSKSLLRETAYGSSVDVCGTLERTAKNQQELKVDKLRELGKCPLSEGYPFYPKKSYAPDYIRNYLHLRPQNSTISSTLRVRHHAVKCFTNHLEKEGFFQMHTPIITSNDCEGAGEAFLVKPASRQLLQMISKKDVPLEERYFDGPSFLTVSGQLHLEALAHGLGKVYSFGPTFRAENCKSPIHLSEFYMLELEEAFLDSLEELSNRIESLVKSATKSLLDVAVEDVALVREKSTTFTIEESFAWLEKPFPRISFREAINVLQQNKSKLKGTIQPENGINKEQELFLVHHFQSPVFVLSWPKLIKSFYMRECEHDSDLVDALDFLVPHVGELAGGSIRENNYSKLEARLPDHDSLRWYLELRKFGSITTGGFGLGLERYLSWVLNVHNVKDVIAFPRWAHNCAM